MLKKLVKKKQFSIALISILMMIVVTLINSNFLSVANFIDMAKGNIVYGTMAIGMMLILITGGIDLSVPGNITLSSVICGTLLAEAQLALPFVILMSVLTSLLIGLVNGVIITKIKIPPMVATLGVNTILMATVLYLTKGNMITNLPQWFKDFGLLTFVNLGDFKIPVQLLFYAFAALLSFFILRYTLLGRGIYAIGGSELSASRVGYDIDHIKMFIYAFNGALVGLAAVLNTSIVQGVNPNTYLGIDMTVISIAVIGGASTMGGVGTVSGTLIGTVLMAVLSNGLTLARVPTYWQKIVMGLVILLAISVDVINRNKEKAKLVHVDVEE